MKRCAALALACLLLLSSCGLFRAEASPTAPVSPPVSSSPTPSPTPSPSPSPSQEAETPSAFEQYLPWAIQRGRMVGNYEYETGQFMVASRRAIDDLGALFFYAAREEISSARDIDFSEFWDPQADPAVFDPILKELRSFGGEDFPIGWANVNAQPLEDYTVEGYNGEEITVHFYGGIKMLSPEPRPWADPMDDIMGLILDYNLTFVCRDKCWYISQIEDLGP